MINLNLQLSEVQDPYRSDENPTQVDLQQSGYFKYRRNVILDRIGNKENKINIDLYLESILKNDDKEEVSFFLKKCYIKILDVYNITTKDYLDLNFGKLIDEKFLKLLVFMELDLWIPYIVNSLEKPDLDILYNDKKRMNWLINNYNIFINNLSKYKKDFNKIIYYHLTMGSMTDSLITIDRLISKNIGNFITNYFLTEEI
tara:strand:+ start:1122 stop:1724 length:603 start_codon:yes stop_codon:yes gene_type:complete